MVMTLLAYIVKDALVFTIPVSGTISNTPGYAVPVKKTRKI